MAIRHFSRHVEGPKRGATVPCLATAFLIAAADDLASPSEIPTPTGGRRGPGLRARRRAMAQDPHAAAPRSSRPLRVRPGRRPRRGSTARSRDPGPLLPKRAVLVRVDGQLLAGSPGAPSLGRPLGRRLRRLDGLRRRPPTGRSSLPRRLAWLRLLLRALGVELGASPAVRRLRSQRRVRTRRGAAGRPRRRGSSVGAAGCGAPLRACGRRLEPRADPSGPRLRALHDPALRHGRAGRSLVVRRFREPARPDRNGVPPPGRQVPPARRRLGGICRLRVRARRWVRLVAGPGNSAAPGARPSGGSEGPSRSSSSTVELGAWPRS